MLTNRGARTRNKPIPITVTGGRTLCPGLELPRVRWQVLHVSAATPPDTASYLTKTPLGMKPLTTCVKSTTSLTRKSTAMLASDRARSGVSPSRSTRK